MKNNLFSKIIASIVVMIFVLSAVVTTKVFAADTTYTITIKNAESGHHYEAYQIFTGDLYEETDESEEEREELKDRKKVLSNIKWGNGIKDNELISALKSDSTLSSKFPAEAYTPREIAVILEGFGEDSAELKAFAEVVGKHLKDEKVEFSETEGVYTVEVDKPGYYFIKDKDSSLPEADYKAYTRYMLKVAGNINIQPKSEKPTVDKSLSETSKEDDVGQHAINEKFKYYLTATLTANKEYGEYKQYKLIFEDTMDSGITVDEVNSVIIKGAKGVSNAPLGDIQVPEKTTDNGNGTYSKEVTDGKLTITVNDLVTILNSSSADIEQGLDVVVTYTAHLNENANISKEKNSEENKPNVNTVQLKYSNDPNKDTNESMGTTLEDKVYVFTYGVDNIKYSKYATEDNEKKKPLSGAGFKLYKKDGVETEIKLKKVDGETAYYPVKKEEEAGAVDMMYSEEGTGKFNIIGLDAGNYVLKEEKTPDGYNTCDPIEIVIKTKLEETEDGNSATVSFEGSEHMVNDIINVRGSKLPSTGSIALVVITGVAIILGVSGIILSKNKKKE